MLTSELIEALEGVMSGTRSFEWAHPDGLAVSGDHNDEWKAETIIVRFTRAEWEAMIALRERARDAITPTNRVPTCR